jgi:hypothetical protein
MDSATCNDGIGRAHAMSRFSEYARDAGPKVYQGFNPNKIRDGFVGWAGVSPENCSIQTKNENIGMSGVLAVRDLDPKGNHCLLTRPDDSSQHVEPKLLTDAGKCFKSKGLKHAKIVIYLQDSPCKKCTNALLELCQNCAKAIVGTTANCYFVFNFTRYYIRKGQSTTTDPLKVWASEPEAKEGYKSVTEAGGTVTIGGDTYNFINFRVSGDYGHLKVARAPDPVIVPCTERLAAGSAWKKPLQVVPTAIGPPKGAQPPVNAWSKPPGNMHGAPPPVVVQQKASQPPQNAWKKR